MKKTTLNKLTLGNLLISAKEQFLLFFNKSFLSSFNLEPPSFLFKTSQKLCLVFFFLGFFSANAATIYVNSATGSDANAGTIGAPYKTFHKAYTMAASSDAINLTGTFDWTAIDEIGDAATSGYILSKSLIIEGQGPGLTFIQSASSRNIADRRVFTISSGFAISIKNLTIRYGYLGANQSGGGLLLNSSSQIINLENLVIEQNDVNSSGYNYGGGGVAIFNSNSTADINISQTEISNNATSAWGGGVYTSGTSGSSSNKTIVSNSTFSGNTAVGAGAIAAYYGRNFVLINSTLTGNTGSTAVTFSNQNTGSVFFLNNTIAYNTVSSNSAYLEFVSSATLQNNIIAENRNSSSVLQGYITQRNVVPAYYNNIIDLIPTNWVASNDVQNGVNGNFVGTNLTLGLSSTLNLNSSSFSTKTLSISCASVASNSGSSSNYGYSVPTSDQRGLSRNGATDIGSFENQSAAPISGSVSSSELVCYNTSASDIVLTGSTGSLQWQSSINNSTWTNITGATNATLTSSQIGVVTSSKFFRANVTNSGCSTVSNTAKVDINNGLAFDGVGDFASVGNHASLNFTGNFTIESWVNVPSTVKYSINTIFSKNVPNLGTPGYNFSFNSWNTSNLLLSLEDGVSVISSNKPVVAGAWNHVAVVVSGNGTFGTFYINGIEAGSGTVQLTNASAVNEFIGSMDASGNYSLNGTLDELRVWNVARTQQQLLDNLDNPLVGNEAGLVVYYDFDQGVPAGTNSGLGLTVKDQTTNSFDGTFNGLSLTGSSSNFVNGNNLSVIAAQSNLCMNATFPKLRFGGTGKTPSAYQWYSNTSASTSGSTLISGSVNNNYDVATSTGGTIYYYLNASGTCASSTTSNFANVTIQGNQSGVISGADYIYLGHAGNYTSNVTSASTNPWVLSNTAFATTTTSGVVTAVASGTPTLTFTSNLGCVSTKIINVVPVEWLGTTSTDWTIGSNWNGAYVPTNISTLGLNANATSDLVLNGSKTVTTLTFNGANRKVDLGIYDLAATTINGVNATNYVKTSGTGKLIMTLANNASKVFPIGNVAYNPLTITNNSGASDVFSARVLVGAFMEGLTGAAITSTVLNRTWDISKTNANAGSGVDFVFNWNAGEVANGNFVTPKLNHYSSTTSNWEVPTVATSVFGSNMLTITGYTGSFSPFTVAEGPTALPVEMVFFLANCSEADVEIQWQTASEHNSDYFQLETSLDAVNWEIIQTIPAAGFSQELLNYSAIDFNANRKQKYYRLKQVDFNGEFKIYGPLKADCVVESTNIGLHPNPCVTEVTLSIASQIPTEVNYTLISPEGKVLENKQMGVQSGITLFTLDVSNYPSGMYMLQFDMSNKRFIKKLTVQ